jgi:hypothetical protein
MSNFSFQTALFYLIFCSCIKNNYLDIQTNFQNFPCRFCRVTNNRFFDANFANYLNFRNCRNPFLLKYFINFHIILTEKPRNLSFILSVNPFTRQVVFSSQQKNLKLVEAPGTISSTPKPDCCKNYAIINSAITYFRNTSCDIFDPLLNKFELDNDDPKTPGSTQDVFDEFSSIVASIKNLSAFKLEKFYSDGPYIYFTVLNFLEQQSTGVATPSNPISASLLSNSIKIQMSVNCHSFKARPGTSLILFSILGAYFFNLVVNYSSSINSEYGAFTTIDSSHVVNPYVAINCGTNQMIDSLTVSPSTTTQAFDSFLSFVLFIIRSRSHLSPTSHEINAVQAFNIYTAVVAQSMYGAYIDIFHCTVRRPNSSDSSDNQSYTVVSATLSTTLCAAAFADDSHLDSSLPTQLNGRLSHLPDKAQHLFESKRDTGSSGTLPLKAKDGVDEVLEQADLPILQPHPVSNPTSAKLLANSGINTDSHHFRAINAERHAPDAVLNKSLRTFLTVSARPNFQNDLKHAWCNLYGPLNRNEKLSHERLYSQIEHRYITSQELPTDELAPRTHVTSADSLSNRNIDVFSFFLFYDNDSDAAVADGVVRRVKIGMG